MHFCIGFGWGEGSKFDDDDDDDDIQMEGFKILLIRNMGNLSARVGWPYKRI